MIQKNPYAAYNNSKIQTATPAELTLLLYEGAIKFTNIAIVAIEKGDIESIHLIYDEMSIRDYWLEHLDWLNTYLKIQTIKKQDFNNWFLRFQV
jgi:flagellar biosynthetic protein FliS